jgi:hypothetical protein
MVSLMRSMWCCCIDSHRERFAGRAPLADGALNPCDLWTAAIESNPTTSMTAMLRSDIAGESARCPWASFGDGAPQSGSARAHR